MPLKVKLWQGFNYYVLDEQQPTWTKLRNVIEYHEKHGAIFKFSTLLLRFHSLTAKELKEQKKNLNNNNSCELSINRLWEIRKFAQTTVTYFHTNSNWKGRFVQCGVAHRKYVNSFAHVTLHFQNFARFQTKNPQWDYFDSIKNTHYTYRLSTSHSQVHVGSFQPRHLSLSGLFCYYGFSSEKTKYLSMIWIRKWGFSRIS